MRSRSRWPACCWSASALLAVSGLARGTTGRSSMLRGRIWSPAAPPGEAWRPQWRSRAGRLPRCVRLVSSAPGMQPRRWSGDGSRPRSSMPRHSACCVSAPLVISVWQPMRSSIRSWDYEVGADIGDGCAGGAPLLRASLSRVRCV